MSLSLPIGIVMAFAINLLVSIYFFALYKEQREHQSYLYWAGSCALFALGIAATVGSHALGNIQILNSVACLILYSATYGLFYGLNAFELTRSSARLLKKAQTLFFAGAVAILVASLYGQVVNATTSVCMAIMFLITEGFFYHRRSPYQAAYAVLRGVLLLHAFILFLQGVVILVMMASGNDSAIVQLFETTLLTHLILTVATALLLPVLHLLRQRHHWEKVASRDDLTGLLSRRTFIQKAYGSIADPKIERHALLMVDIDHFKAINDTFGHQCGDDVLRQVAKTLRCGIRETDLIGRLGGEEFAILMPGLSVDRAHVVANRLLQAVADNELWFEDNVINVTISVGIAASTDVLDSWDALFENADNALYSAKREGRNLVFMFGQSIPSQSI
ncbi:GGDEF domain-containing protein [Alteromonas sp. H39]|uniref:GGDEF domain-containing protein n=1 Tax=Alteromonas sp. H39 TaxID=3389876 RepID=UPI0039DFB7FE